MPIARFVGLGRLETFQAFTPGRMGYILYETELSGVGWKDCVLTQNKLDRLQSNTVLCYHVYRLLW